MVGPRVSRLNIAQSVTLPPLDCRRPRVHPGAIISPGKWCTRTWPYGYLSDQDTLMESGRNEDEEVKDIKTLLNRLSVAGPTSSGLCEKQKEKFHMLE
ncbi:hypothetical protein DPX16_23167 [Anabarilius grahami]|uniref:Uncharacterized protein n=1 Tax=Anabarilius grahami TaxID=495550 RepID=A0A3N0XHT7_ANAGA|nr:hypothetical protein DPX16_23167 [Anabarilius grahami]